MDTLRDMYMTRRCKKYETKYDNDIRIECDEFKTMLDDCLGRLNDTKHCKFDHVRFVECVDRFDSEFRFKYRLPHIRK